MDHTDPKLLEIMKMAQQTIGQRFLSDKEYFDIFNFAVGCAKKCMEQDGNVHNAMFLHGKLRDGKQGDPSCVMPFTFMDWPPPGGKKYEAMQGIGIMFCEKFPDYMLTEVIHMSEAWIAHYDPAVIDKTEWPYLPKGEKSPAERDDRIEVLTVSATSIDQRISYKHIPIKRDAAEKFCGWGEEISHIYDKDKIHDPKMGADYLSIQVLLGYFMGSRKS